MYLAGVLLLFCLVYKELNSSSSCFFLLALFLQSLKKFRSLQILFSSICVHVNVILNLQKRCTCLWDQYQRKTLVIVHVSINWATNRNYISCWRYTIVVGNPWYSLGLYKLKQITTKMVLSYMEKNALILPPEMFNWYGWPVYKSVWLIFKNNFLFMHVSNIWICVVSCVSLAVWHGKNLTSDIMCKLPNLDLLPMLGSIVAFYHFIPLSAALH